MARQFFDLIAEEERAQREDEIHEFMQSVEDQLEELFSMVFALTLRTSAGVQK